MRMLIVNPIAGCGYALKVCLLYTSDAADEL